MDIESLGRVANFVHFERPKSGAVAGAWPTHRLRVSIFPAWHNTCKRAPAQASPGRRGNAVALGSDGTPRRACHRGSGGPSWTAGPKVLLTGGSTARCAFRLPPCPECPAPARSAVRRCRAGVSPPARFFPPADFTILSALRRASVAKDGDAAGSSRVLVPRGTHRSTVSARRPPWHCASTRRSVSRRGPPAATRCAME